MGVNEGSLDEGLFVGIVLEEDVMDSHRRKVVDLFYTVFSYCVGARLKQGE